MCGSITCIGVQKHRPRQKHFIISVTHNQMYLWLKYKANLRHLPDDLFSSQVDDYSVRLSYEHLALFRKYCKPIERQLGMFYSGRNKKDNCFQIYMSTEQKALFDTHIKPHHLELVVVSCNHKSGYRIPRMFTWDELNDFVNFIPDISDAQIDTMVCCSCFFLCEYV